MTPPESHKIRASACPLRPFRGRRPARHRAQGRPALSVVGHDTMKTRRSLEAAGRSYDYFSLAAAADAGLGDIARLPFSLKVLLENLLRYEDGGSVTVDDVHALAAWLETGSSTREIAYRPARVLMQDFTGVPAVVDLAAIARRHGGARRRPGANQPAVGRRSGDRPFGDGRSLRLGRFLPAQRRIRNETQWRALRLPALGPAGVRRFPRRAAGHRNLPPGQPRISRPGDLDPGRRRRVHRRARHPGRHRQPHHHGQRPRRARLGRRRHRGRGGDARPTDLDADPRGHRLQADRGDGRGHDGDRSGADRGPDAARQGRRRQVRRVLRPRPRRAGARRPRDDRQYGARVRRDMRLLSDRPGNAQLPRALGPAGRADRAGRNLRQGAGHVARRRDARSGVHRYARARHRDGRAEYRRAQAAAGQGDAVGCGGGLRYRARRHAGRRRGRRRVRHDRGGRRRRFGNRHRAAHARRRRGRGRRSRTAPRRRRDRRDHQLHQHLEPERHARRRADRAQRAQPRLARQALGQDLAGARLARGDRLSRRRRAAGGLGRARLQPGRLRLHHLHRQFGSAAAGHRPGGRAGRSGGHLGAVGQSQLRGPDKLPSARQPTWRRRRSSSPTRWPAR